jgi:hypothetical protein
MQRLLDATRQMGGGVVEMGNGTLDRSRWVVTLHKPTRPAATYIYSKATGRLEKFYGPSPWLAKYKFAPMKPIAFAARDGTPLGGYVTLPLGKTPRNLPLVVLVHGGPWGDRDKWEFRSDVQMLANRGYAVLNVNYRGTTGLGKRFARAAKKQFGGAMHTDLLDGVAYLAKQGLIDTTHVAIMGGSYGGYATLVGLTPPEATRSQRRSPSFSTANNDSGQAMAPIVLAELKNPAGFRAFFDAEVLKVGSGTRGETKDDTGEAREGLRAVILGELEPHAAREPFLGERGAVHVQRRGEVVGGHGRRHLAQRAVSRGDRRAHHLVEQLLQLLDVLHRLPLRKPGALVAHLQAEEERRKERHQARALLRRGARREHPQDVVEHLEAGVPVRRLLAAVRPNSPRIASTMGVEKGVDSCPYHQKPQNSAVNLVLLGGLSLRQ